MKEQINNYVQRDIDHITRTLKYNVFKKEMITEILEKNNAFVYFKISRLNRDIFLYDASQNTEPRTDEVEHYSIKRHGHIIEIKTELRGLHGNTISNFLDYIPFYTLVVFFAVFLIYYTSDYLFTCLSKHRNYA